MSAGPESSADLVAVACVVDASLLLASEWSRILTEYVYPLLKRLSELHPSHQFRLAFVTYGAADTRPQPLLSKRFFAPLSQVTKELREEPSKLGIGQTNSASSRGLSALEGLVAAIELFDILMASANFSPNHVQTQSPQKDNRSLISHLLHIAASPPDGAQRPYCNTLQHLDFVTWESIPAELKKRKINLSLISLRKIPQFQDLQSSVAGSGAQSPWFNVRAPHVLLLAGFPTPQKTSTKRQTDSSLSDQSPDTKRQKVVSDPISKTSSASPALPSARITQNQRPQQPVSSQAPQPPPTTVSGQNPSPAQPAQPTTSVLASTPATATPSAPPPPSVPFIPVINAEVLEQLVAPTGLKFGQMMERHKVLEREIATMDSQISNAQNTGQTVIVAGLQKDLASKVHLKEQIKILLRQHYQKILLAKEALNAQAGAAGSGEVGPSTQSHPPNAPGASSERPTGPTMEEHKPVIPDSQVLAQFWQSRGGTISAANGSNPQAGPSQTQSHPTATPEVAAQMQKLIEKKGIRPQSFGSSSQASGTTPHETGVNPNTTNIQALATSTWQGTFSWTFPKFNGQVANEGQIHVVGIVAPPTPNDVRTDTWPKNLTLNRCKEPLKDTVELSFWLKRQGPRTHLVRFGPSPRAPDGSVNELKFHELSKFMADHRVYAYAGWQLPSGKFSYNIIIFSVGSSFAGAVFPEGLSDLPGSGNTLDVQPAVEEAKPQPSSGLNFPPALIARMQGLEPAKQRQLFAHFIRAQQQEQLRRQQLQQTQQTQQTHTASSQTLNSLGMSPSQYGAVANIPAGLNVGTLRVAVGYCTDDLHTKANVNGPPNSGAYNTGGGTVNYEMLQSFMQRSVEGSASQGMNTG
ncbi:hypothetical protein J3R83DRAFT_12188 [Lanmaoa asiatica]|nr:hypothetical protein J3R83DRAFT_12188 [Lanmaoa asiatica]